MHSGKPNRSVGMLLCATVCVGGPRNRGSMQITLARKQGWPYLYPRAAHLVACSFGADPGHCGVFFSGSFEKRLLMNWHLAVARGQEGLLATFLAYGKEQAQKRMSQLSSASISCQERVSWHSPRKTRETPSLTGARRTVLARLASSRILKFSKL